MAVENGTDRDVSQDTGDPTGFRPLICVPRSGFRKAHPRADDDDSRARETCERISDKSWIKKV